jgi:hypothetical protein
VTVWDFATTTPSAQLRLRHPAQHRCDGGQSERSRASAGSDARPSGARAFYVIDNYQQGKPMPSANDILQDYNFKIAS